MKINKLEDIKDIHAKFISSTNKQMEFNLKGKHSTLNYYSKVLWFGNMHTSYVNHINIHNNILTVYTRNSIYVFKLLESEFEESDIKIDNS